MQRVVSVFLLNIFAGRAGQRSIRRLPEVIATATLVLPGQVPYTAQALARWSSPFVSLENGPVTRGALRTTS